MSTAKTELLNLEIVEGSFVDKGDNPEAHIAFFKRADAAEKEYGTDHDQKMVELKASLMHNIGEIFEYEEPGEWPSMLMQSVDELKDVLGEMGHKISKDNTAVDTDGSSEETVTSKKKTEKSFDEVMAELSEEQQAVIRGQMDSASKAAEEAGVEAEKAKAEAAEKAAAEADVSKRLEDLEKRAADAEALVAKMKDEQLTAEFEKRAAEIGGGEIEKMARLLKSAYGRSEEEGKELESQFRAMSAQAKLGNTLFKSVGSSAHGTDDASPEDILEAATKRIRESNPGLAYHEAYKMALSQNRDAYARSVNVRSVAE